MKLLYPFFLVCLLSFAASLENFDKRFFEDCQNGEWLVMFYSPKCIFCAKFRPVFEQAANRLSDGVLRVGRLDGSKYKIPEEFNIVGYPQIMYIKNNVKHIYTGYHILENLLDYVGKMRGSAVEHVETDELMDSIRKDQKVFFVFAGSPKSLEGKLLYKIAEEFQPNAVFYETSPKMASALCSFQQPPIFVYKEGICIGFEKSLRDAENFENDLREWVNVERFEIFPNINLLNRKQFELMKKYIVVTAVDGNRNEHLDFLHKMKNFCLNSWMKFHDKFQCAWTKDVRFAYSLIWDDVRAPFFFVKNLSEPNYYLPSEKPLELDRRDIEYFLLMVGEKQVLAVGGHSIRNSIKIFIFEIEEIAIFLWNRNPLALIIVTLMLLGLIIIPMYIIFGDKKKTENNVASQTETPKAAAPQVFALKPASEKIVGVEEFETES